MALKQQSPTIPGRLSLGAAVLNGSTVFLCLVLLQSPFPWAKFIHEDLASGSTSAEETLEITHALRAEVGDPALPSSWSLRSLVLSGLYSLSS